MKSFSMRDVLWLTIVIALCLGWFVDHMAMSSRLHSIYQAALRIEDRLREKGYDIPRP